VDEFGPLQVKPQAGSSWAPQGKPDRLRATYTRPHGIGYLFGAYDLEADLLRGAYRRKRGGREFLEHLRYLRRCYPLDERLMIIADNLSTHTTPKVMEWLPEHNAELVLLPTYSSWLNRIEGHFAALRSFVIAGSDHPNHDTIERELHRYLRWRNTHRDNPALRRSEKRGCLS